jgi:precorrin-2/cobalt-factor-2 C20-methyltransferase
MKRGKLVIIGVGPGDPELITLKAVKAIRAADVIACPAKRDEPGIAYRIAVEAVPDIREKEVLLLDFPMTNDNLEQAHREA